MSYEPYFVNVRGIVQKAVVGADTIAGIEIADTNYRGAYYFCPRLSDIKNNVGEVNKLAKSVVPQGFVQNQEVPSLDVLRKGVLGREPITLQSIMKIFLAIRGIANAGLPQSPHYAALFKALECKSIIPAWRYVSSADLRNLAERLGLQDVGPQIFPQSNSRNVTGNVVWHHMTKGYDTGEYTYTEVHAQLCYEGLLRLATQSAVAVNIPAFDDFFRPDPSVAPRQGHSTRALALHEGQYLEAA